ncbi:hypothetical protein N7468_007488 [Penicillium chermesinum]|uniref:Uncharacterized protein n=1 Tax=Penicillium chermesinum TaxID=63820 RepID=A0A9W9TKQ3_9EURO|nr:uncharacterized protein N7468_007488 [Penicillium chermesinum]KAJ5226263.1 hypothetical protein N7468_007488 [Penicillium chermesinum]
MSELEHRSRAGDERRDQGVFRVKRKHVLKACDRVMGSSPAIGAPYTTIRVCSGRGKPLKPKFTLEEDTQANQIATRTSRFVEMLESHHSLVVKALQKLYKFCVNNEGFPGEPLAEAPDGHPLTHAILDRLGLIKQAEENADELDEDTEDLRYLRLLSTSTECSATAEPSPEPVTPPEPSPASLPGALSAIPCPVPSWRARSQTGHIGASAVPHTMHHDPSFTYYLEGGCTAADAPADIKPATRMHGMMPEHQHQTGNMPAEMIGDFPFQGQEAPFFPGFTSGWSFPPG